MNSTKKLLNNFRDHDLNFGGGVVGGGYFSFNPPPPHPQNLSHIYDTLPFMFEYQGWGGGGGYFSFNPPPTNPPPKFKSYLWYPDIYVWVLGVGVVISH